MFRAIAQAMVQSFTLWQGPPGTGKTRTLVALMDVLVQTMQADGSRREKMGAILACADTNAAVDNLVEGLKARGLRVVRVGHAAKVGCSARAITLVYIILFEAIQITGMIPLGQQKASSCMLRGSSRHSRYWMRSINLSQQTV